MEHQKFGAPVRRQLSANAFSGRASFANGRVAGSYVEHGSTQFVVRDVDDALESGPYTPAELAPLECAHTEWAVRSSNDGDEPDAHTDTHTVSGAEVRSVSEATLAKPKLYKDEHGDGNAPKSGTLYGVAWDPTNPTAGTSTHAPPQEF